MRSQLRFMPYVVNTISSVCTISLIRKTSVSIERVVELPSHITRVTRSSGWTVSHSVPCCGWPGPVQGRSTPAEEKGGILLADL